MSGPTLGEAGDIVLKLEDVSRSYQKQNSVSLIWIIALSQKLLKVLNELIKGLNFVALFNIVFT